MLSNSFWPESPNWMCSLKLIQVIELKSCRSRNFLTPSKFQNHTRFWSNTEEHRSTNGNDNIADTWQMPRPPSSHGNWSISLTTERRNKRTIDNYDVTKRYVHVKRHRTHLATRGWHHGNVTVKPLSSQRKMNTMEYVCTTCNEIFDTERNYLNHRDQNHLGQRWKCHLCNRYLCDDWSDLSTAQKFIPMNHQTHPIKQTLQAV